MEQAVAQGAGQVAGRPVRHARPSSRGRCASGRGSDGAARTTVSGATPPAARGAEPAQRRRRRRVPRRGLALALGFLLGLGVLFGWLRARTATQPARRGRRKRLAVLPFENLGAAEDEYFADGITDEVRGKLAALPALQVIARSSSSQYKQHDQDAAADRAGAGRASTC